MSVLATPRLLVGRKIVSVELQAFGDISESGHRLKTCYDPIFILDNGARVFFIVDETDNVGVYGIRPCYVKAEKVKASK